MTRTILFVCTGNSARSIMAEAYMNHAGGAVRWRAFSAGSTPTGKPNPHAIATLRRHGIDPGAPTSQSWNDYAEGAAGAPALDVVVTVCDNAAGEICPVWPRAGAHPPQTLHWSFPDPAAAPPETIEARFETVFADIRARIDAFLKDVD